MNFEIIETQRLILKSISPEQMKSIFTDLTKAEIMNILGHRSEEDFLKEEYKHLRGYSSYNRSFRLFLLTDKNSNKIIGRCGIHNWNPDHRRAELGYVMEDESYKRKGLMSEAIRSIIDHGFVNMHLNRMEAIVGVGNIASLKLMEKFRFVKEGLLRQHVQVSEQAEDSYIFSLLYHEYMAHKQLS